MSFRLINIQEIKRIAEIRTRDAVLALVALLAVVFWGMLEGILVAVLLSMLTLVHESRHPPILLLGRKPGTDDFRPHNEHPDDETVEGLLVVRPEGSIYFANADYFADRILDLAAEMTPVVHVVLLDGGAVPDFEYTGLVKMRWLIRELNEEGIEVWIAGLNRRPLEMARKALAQTSGTQVRFFLNVEEAVKVYLSQAGNGE